MRLHLDSKSCLRFFFKSLDCCISVKIKAAVIVLSDYPVRPPLFTLAVSSNGSYIKNDYIRVCMFVYNFSGPICNSGYKPTSCNKLDDNKLATT